MWGVIYTLLAAASFGLNNATVRRGVLTGTVMQAVIVSMPIGFVVFVGAAWVSGELSAVTRISGRSYALLAAAGIVHFLLGRYCNYRSIEAIGANLSTPAQQGTLLVSLVLALIFLGEVLTPLKIVGIALLVVAPAMLFRRHFRPRVIERKSVGAAAAPKPDFESRLVEGYTYAFLSSLFYGTSPILVRAGLQGSGLALGGGVISYGAAAAVMAFAFLWPRTRRDVATLDRQGIVWFGMTGITVCFSQMFLYMALSVAPVTLVQPLMRFSPVFRTMFSWIINREHEDFSAGVMWAIVVSLVGTAALSLDTSFVVRSLDAPPWLASFLSWSWPG